MAVRAIRHHAIRSLLTLLGIVIGISGIIAISALGKGAQQKARQQWLTYGSKGVAISPGNWMSHLQKPPKPLLLDNISMIRSQCPAAQYITPCVYRSQIPIEYEGKKSSAEVYGFNECNTVITDEKMLQGNYFTAEHVDRKDNVAVIPPEIAQLFFATKDPLGAVIRIKKIPFIVIGVLAPPKVKGKWEGLGMPRISIPFSTHQKYFGGGIHQIALCTYTDQEVAQVVRQLEKIFRAAHNLEEGQPNDFMIWDNQTLAQAAEEASKSVGIFALIAAIIALLVGGIGVMNIMLVAVQERTKEIGIKLALGATMNIIRMQFLIEAVIICMIGGLLGILFGVTASLIFDQWIGLTAIVEPGPIVAAFLCTVLIGLLFGFYPAERAARLKPVEALTEY